MSIGTKIIVNALIWGVLIVAVAVFLNGAPYKERIITFLGLGLALTQSWLLFKIKKDSGSRQVETTPNQAKEDAND